MLTIRRVLRNFAPLVRFYVIDAKLNNFGHGHVRITVGVPPNTSQHLRDRLWTDLTVCPTHAELVDICEDIGVAVKPGRPIQVSIKIIDQGEDAS